MASIPYDRIVVETSSTGTGAITPGAAASASFRTFAEAAVPDATPLTLMVNEGNDVEVFESVYSTAGPSLSRGTTRWSKIGGTVGTSKLSLTGSAVVRVVWAAADILGAGAGGGDGEAFAETFAFAGDGEETVFDLAVSIPGLTAGDIGYVFLFLDGIWQQQGVHFTVSGTEITFVDAPEEPLSPETANIRGVVTGPTAFVTRIVWQGDWVTATDYVLNDAVAHDGRSYIATLEHTSGSSTEPGVGVSWEDNWDLMADKGADGGGSGSGDVTAAANIANNAMVVGDGGAKGIKAHASGAPGGAAFLNVGTSAGTVAAGNDTRFHDAVTLAGSPNYITIAGQVITRALINLASHVTGTLGIGDGGTGQTTAAAAFGALKQNATDAATGVVEHATAAEVRASTAGNLAIITSQLNTAAAYVTLTDAAPVAVPWDGFINGVVTITANRALGNPSDGVAGQVRAILVKGDGGTDRSLSFGSEYEGDLPSVAVTSTTWVELQIKCHASDHFSVAGMTVLKP